MAVARVMAGGQDLHPFFKPRQNFPLDARTPSSTEGPLRKRQRTHSPDDQLTIASKWENEHSNRILGKPEPNDEQEVSAGTQPISEVEIQEYKDKVLADTRSAIGISITNDLAPILSDDVTTVTPRCDMPPERMLKVRPDGKLASPKILVENLETQASGILCDAVPSQQRLSKAPKRNLKISADGTLHSPNVEASIDPPRRRGRKKKSDIGTLLKPSHIAVLKYKVVNGIKASLGRQIDEILLGKGPKTYVESEKLSVPPKSTHPFFTGELGRKVKHEAVLADIYQPGTGADLQGSQSQKAIPFKTPTRLKESRITSKPPTAGQGLRVTHDGNLPAFGTDHAKVTRFPGALEPMWPPYGMVHVGCSSVGFEDRNDQVEGSHVPDRGRKLKDAQIHILPEENILNKVTKMLDLFNSSDNKVPKIPCRDARQFRRPHRKVMTGTQLQQAIRSRISCATSGALVTRAPSRDELSSSQPSHGSLHRGILNLVDRLPNSSSAFDKFQCETQEWTHKYSPKCAEHVLQQGREAEILRDWLKGLTVSSVGGGSDDCRARDSSVMSRRGGMKSGPKKKRRTEELDDFVVSSDEEANEMAEILDAQDPGLSQSHDKKSVMRAGIIRDRGRTANAVVVSGPHGCGKTAAVFAAARELDFEIFEVNSGSRRSGKDILDKVGDMTRNHLVKHRQDTDPINSIDQSSESLLLDEKFQADLSSGRQGTMKSFFNSQVTSKPTTPKADGNSIKSESKKGKPKKKILQEVLSKPRDQKQSLILLEEVDILFDEDKLFWSTVLDLISRSKRPVVMTCSDESLLPLDDMSLHAIFRFTPAPADLATDYLLLVAASEGHLLSRDSVQSLYKVRGSDLRASLAELNFYCQMGIGDNKGGLEWILLDNASHTFNNREPLRVISEDTYSSGMGWLSGEDTSFQAYRSLDEVIELSAEVWNGWHVDLGATELLQPLNIAQVGNTSREAIWRSLQLLDYSYEAFSAADVLPASVVRHGLSRTIDTNQPRLSDSTRFSYIEGVRLLHADPLTDHTTISDSLAFALRASAGNMFHGSKGFSINVQQVYNIIPLALARSKKNRINLLKMMSAFQPIADDPSSAYAVSKSMSSSSFDGPLSVILQDVAPYVRGIVSYDLRLEEQRRQLSALFTKSGTGKQKTRTTRASRAALEGGCKANTRRERWFPKPTNFNSILDTGGEDWQKVALQMSFEHIDDHSVENCGSRRSSISSRAGTDI